MLTGRARAAALMSLKRKKMIESQLEQVENNLQRILEQQTMLEDQRLNMEALLAQQYAAKASKASMQARSRTRLLWAACWLCQLLLGRLANLASAAALPEECRQGPAQATPCVAGAGDAEAP